MQCNIDARGKFARLVTGAIVETVGLALLVLWWLGLVPTWTAAVGGMAVISGWFLVYEGLAGWCILRAMGFRTPL